MLAEIEIKARNSDCIRVLQITDTHIFESTEDSFDGLNASDSLAAVIRDINQQESPDLVLMTGDLVHNPVTTAYLKLKRQLFSLEAPTFCLPGNHDDTVLMQRLLNENTVHTNKTIKAGQWRILLLDTCLDGSHAGRLKREELEFLEQSLERHPEKFVLVSLHHPPVAVGSAWMDEMMLQNPESLFSLLDNYEQVRVLIWGHIHQEFRAERRGVILYGSPSTCIQFKPGSDSYARDELNPGYSIIQLHGDGRLEIDTQRI
jgi:Icc protein